MAPSGQQEHRVWAQLTRSGLFQLSVLAQQFHKHPGRSAQVRFTGAEDILKSTKPLNRWS